MFINKDGCTSIAIAIFCFCSLTPFYTFTTLFYILHKISLFIILVSTLSSIYDGGLKRSAIYYTLCLFSAILLMSLYNQTIIHYISYATLIFASIQFLKYKVLLQAGYYFRDIYIGILSISMIFYILVLFGIITPTDVEYAHHNMLKINDKVYYEIYYDFLMVQKSDITWRSENLILRFQGLFDEPGVVGTVSGLLLIAIYRAKFGIRSFLLVVFGLLSMSKAFFVLFFICLCLKRKYKIIGISALSCSLILVFVYNLSPLLWNWLVAKVERGDNRVSECFWNAFESNFYNSPLLGLGNRSTALLGCDISSFFSLIYDYGIFGFSAIVIFNLVGFFLIQRKNNDPEATSRKMMILIIWSSIFILNTYQRPQYLLPMHAIIFCVFLSDGFLGRLNKNAVKN